jgi:SAM-dependent methyltransferase
MPPNPPTYPFDNTSAHATDHHTALSELYDGESSTRVRALGIDWHTAHCWDIGAGAGGFARWLTTQVGPHGRVLATDINPHLIPEHPRLQTQRHDIITDPIPDPGTWTFIGTRLVLNHLPPRRDVLAKLVSALTPGGWLLTQDVISEPPETFVAWAANPDDAVLLQTYHRAVLTVLDRHGNDRHWATQAAGAMLDEGLVDVTTKVSASTWYPGSPGTRWMLATMAQIRDELVDAGLKPAHLDRVQQLLDNVDAQVVINGHRLYSSAGRLPT